MIKHDFFKQQVFVVFSLEIVNFEFEIKGANWGGCRFIFGAVQSCEVGVLKCIIDSNASFRVEGNHLLKEIYCKRWTVFEATLES